MGFLVAIVLMGAGATHGTQDIALLVASHAGGPGQERLQFAQEDTQRMAAVLVELAEFDPAQVIQLIDPTAVELLDALDNLTQRPSTKIGRFVFYYSGHGRARSLSLGDDELPLDKLRDLLGRIPARLKLVLLDACQSGAISGVKGVEAAPDFSLNFSRALSSSGTAVLASSTGAELSQESPRLRGSFFTHHLIAALRGAADSDGDGRITLEEAYRYTYDRTLASTAKTRVGKQHVTLETDLRGHGATVLSYPMGWNAHLVLGDRLDGELTFIHKKSGAVLAEIFKVKGWPLRLALPAGNYVATWRSGTQTRQCPVVLYPNAESGMDVRTCKNVRAESTREKSSLGKLRRLSIELRAGIGMDAGQTPYIKTLQRFGYEQNSDDLFSFVQAEILLAYRLLPYLEALIYFKNLGADRYTRKIDGRDYAFGWRSYGGGAALRAGWPLLQGGLFPYVTSGVGLARGSSRLTVGGNKQQLIDAKETFHGYALMAGAGLTWTPWRSGYVSLLAEAGYVHAPALTNLLGDVHNLGGIYLTQGIRLSY